MEAIDIGWVDGGYTSGHFTHSIALQVAYLKDRNLFGTVHASIGQSIIAAGRNQVVEQFLKGDSDWLWFVDTDMVFNEEHVGKLYDMAKEHDTSMVSGLAFILQRPSHVLVPSVFYLGNPSLSKQSELITMMRIPENGERVAATGLASSLIHRKVFEALEAPRHEDYRWFDQIVLPSGQMSGEDTQFFVRAGELGYTLRINTEAVTWHVKEVGFSTLDFIRQQELTRDS